MSNLTELDRLISRNYIKQVLSGEEKIIAIPSWVFVGRRCQDENVFGKCEQASLPDSNYCYYHDKIHKGITTPSM